MPDMNLPEHGSSFFHQLEGLERQFDETLKVYSRPLIKQEMIYSRYNNNNMAKNKSNKAIDVLGGMMYGLFDNLPKNERGTIVDKPKVVKLKPVKSQAKVRLRKTAKDRASKQAYIDDVEPHKMLIKITLAKVKPIVWRKIEVPSNISLEHLHTVIQAAFGWYNEHLHKFIVGKDDIEPKSSGYAFDADYDAWQVSLDEVLSGVGCTIKYLYDFGAQWGHNITLEAVDDYGESEKHLTRMTDGRGACPEEDAVGMQPFNKAKIIARVSGVKQPD